MLVENMHMKFVILPTNVKEGKYKNLYNTVNRSLQSLHMLYISLACSILVFFEYCICIIVSYLYFMLFESFL